MCICSVTEKGLKQAERITDALYKGDVDALGELNYEEVKKIFAGAKVVDILAEPGMSMLQLAMKAECFNSESKRIKQSGLSLNPS